MRRPVVVALLAGLWLLATGPAAGAHAVLRSSDPASGTALDRAPQAVTITFSEVPDPKVSRIRVLDTTGRSMDAGPATPVPGRPTQLRATLGELPRGVYTVSWRVLSKTDGHVTAGVFAFGIGVKVGAVPAAREATAVTSPPPNRLGVVGRWAFYWGLVLLVGAAATGLLVFDRRLHGPWRPLLAGGLGLAVVGLVAMALAERADVGVPFGELLDSSAGEGLIRQGVALLVTAAVLALYLARPRAPALLAALGVSAAAAMAAHVAAGHAAGQSSARWLNLLAQTVHVVAVGAWVGGLVWLLAGVSGDRGVATVKRFSRLAGLALLVVAVTGVLRAWNETREWGRLLDTGYGRTLDVKVLLVVVLAALGALNRRRMIPALATGAARLGALRRVVRVEIGVAALVLLVTGLLTELPPARSVVKAAKPAAPANVQVRGNDYATSVLVDLAVAPGTAGPNTFRAEVVDYDTRAPFPARRVELTFRLPSRPDIGAATLELAKEREGLWTGQGVPLSIDGRWSITTLVLGAGSAVTVPLELQTRQPDVTPTTQQVQVSQVPGQPTVPAGLQDLHRQWEHHLGPRAVPVAMGTRCGAALRRGDPGQPHPVLAAGADRGHRRRSGCRHPSHGRVVDRLDRLRRRQDLRDGRVRGGLDRRGVRHPAAAARPDRGRPHLPAPRGGVPAARRGRARPPDAGALPAPVGPRADRHPGRGHRRARPRRWHGHRRPARPAQTGPVAGGSRQTATEADTAAVTACLW